MTETGNGIVGLFYKTASIVFRPKYLKSGTNISGKD